MVICDICQRRIIENGVQSIVLNKVHYNLCEWDAIKLQDQIEYSKSGHMANIFWGAGHINWTCWYTIREIIRKHQITEVLEFGIGLSSELFVNEGLQVTGFDVYKEHVLAYQNLKSLQNHAKFHLYEDDRNGPPVEELYPGRKWDFVFVDGPQERSREVACAMRVAKKFIYLHDPNMGEEHFFPNDDWIGQGTEPRLFIKRDYL